LGVHDPSPDLKAALNFVVDRISEEAERSGEPLSAGEKHLLQHLPRYPTNPTVTLNVGRKRGWPLMPVMRDSGFERLCTLAKHARKRDLETSATTGVEWKFAARVLGMNDHPMAWLLSWADIRTRGLWDVCLLVCTAIFIVVLCSVIAFLALAFGWSDSKLPLSVLQVTIVVTFVAILGTSFLAMRTLERWLGKRAVEKYRRELPLGSSLCSSFSELSSSQSAPL
jgi:antibiotic biosynthesis monooxygenase (ABM) superfamily enzyme